MKGFSTTTKLLFSSGLVIAFVAFLVIANNPCACSPIPEASEVIRIELKSISSGIGGNSNPKNPEFKKDVIIDQDRIVRHTTIQADEIEFFCNDNDICGANSALDVKRSSVTANINTQAYVVVCGNKSRTVSPKYCVGIGSKGLNARDLCREKCGLDVT